MTQRARLLLVPFLLTALVPLAAGCGSRGGAGKGPCPKCPGQPDGGSATSPARLGAGPSPGQGDGDGGAPSGRRLQHFSLEAAARAFRSHGECVAAVSASLPPELSGESDPANLPERVCQTRRALAEKSVSLCEEIQDAHWPLACRRLLAGLYGRPEACPPLAPRSRGREPACLALASRDASLCRALRRTSERQRCEAILGGPAGCRALRTSADVEACERDRRRWRAVLRPVKPALDPTLVPAFQVAVTAGGRTITRAPAGLGQGVVVPAAAGGGVAVRYGALPPPGDRRAPGRIRIALEVERQDGPVRIALGEGAARPSMTGPNLRRPAPGLPAPAMTRPVPSARPAAGTGRGPATGAGGGPAAAPRPVPASAAVTRGGARLCILWNGKPVPSRSLSGLVELGPVPARRGAEVTGTFTAAFTVGEESVRLTGTLRTFVRDVVPGAWLAGSCAEDLAERARAAGAPSAAAPSGPEEGTPCYFVAHWEGLTQVGYRAYGLRPGGACARLGLRENDVVTAAGRALLRRWSDVTALYRLLGGAGALSVTVRRGGRTVTLKRPVGGAP